MTAISADIVDKYQGVASNRIIQAVEKASAKTGVDFSFLMEKASAESSFDANAKSKSSSATGLYQFVENTWLDMVKKYGPSVGLGQLASKITVDDNGKACVTDCAAKTQILALRKNPEISAMMAGEYSAENKDYLQANVSGNIGSTELSIAHFMGAGGAAKFLNDRQSNPDATAAKLFPKAAMANKGVFYDSSTGKARTLDQVYTIFAKKFSDTTATASASTPSSTTTDAGTPSPSTAATPSLTKVAQLRSASAPAATSPVDPLDLMVTQAPPSSTRGFRLSEITWDKPSSNVAQAARHTTHPQQTVAGGFQKISQSTMLALLNMQNDIAEKVGL